MSREKRWLRPRRMLWTPQLQGAMSSASDDDRGGLSRQPGSAQASPARPEGPRVPRPSGFECEGLTMSYIALLIQDAHILVWESTQ